MYKALLIFHVAAGTMALLCGAIALVSKKGGKAHRKSGNVYYYGMYAVGVSAVLMTLLKFNPFLLAIALFSVYLSYSGMRALFYWRLKEAYVPQLKDKVPYYIALATSLFMIFYPVSIMIREGVFFVPVLSVFGLIMLPMSLKDIAAHNNPEKFKPRNKEWLLNHIGKMSGAYIATVTAFLLNNITFSPGWVIWLAPTAVGTPLITMAIRKWTKKLSKKTAQRVAVMALLCCCLSAQAQSGCNVLRGIVTDQQGVPLSYVGIGIANTGYGTVANDSGRFELYLPDGLSDKDSLKVSCIGYEPMILPVTQLHGPQMIKMRATNNFLSEVIVKPASTRSAIAGSSREGAAMTNNFVISNRPGQNLGAEIAEKIFLKGKVATLKKLNMYINRNTFDTVLFRVNIYAVKKGMPGKNLLHHNIMWPVYGTHTGWAEIDLTPYDLTFNTNIIVSVQWVAHSQKGTYLSVPISMPLPGKVHYYKFGSQGKWKRYFGMATSIYLDMETGSA